MNKLFSCISFLIGVLLVSACNTKDNEEYNPSSLNIGYIPFTDILPYIVAEQQGIYDSLQVDVQWIPMESNRNRDTLFIQQKTQGSILSPMEAFSQQQQGVDVIPVAVNEGLFYVIASSDSTIVRMDDLKEKCLSVEHKGTASDYFVDKLLALFEIDNEQINKPELSNESIRMHMLLNKQVDAAVLRDPYASLALQKGGKLLATSDTIVAPLSVLAFSDSILTNRKSDIEKIIIGYNLGVAYMNSHSQEKWLPEALSKAGIKEQPIRLPKYKQASALSNAEINDIKQWIENKELLPKKHAAYRNNTSIIQTIKHHN